MILASMASVFPVSARCRCGTWIVIAEWAQSLQCPLEHPRHHQVGKGTLEIPKMKGLQVKDCKEAELNELRRKHEVKVEQKCRHLTSLDMQKDVEAVCQIDGLRQ